MTNKESITCDCGVVFETIKQPGLIERTHPYYLCHKCHLDETIRSHSKDKYIEKLEIENEHLKAQLGELRFRFEKQKERRKELENSKTI